MSSKGGTLEHFRIKGESGYKASLGTVTRPVWQEKKRKKRKREKKNYIILIGKEGKKDTFKLDVGCETFDI